MQNDFKNLITIENLTYKNYIMLNNDEKKIALDFRNKNRKWMINQNEIALNEHLKWIDNLKNRDDLLYFMVFKDKKPFMSIDFHDISWEKKECYWGYFLGDDKFKNMVLKVERDILNIGFDYMGMKKMFALSLADNHVINIHRFFGFKESQKLTIDGREYIEMYLTRDKQK